MTPRRTIRARAAGPQRDQEVKGRIVSAAEHVFAEMGVEKATLRDITQRADVNVAAVSYYFGSKSDLVHSVFDQLSTRLNERRTRELDLCMAEAKRAGRPLDLRAVLEIFAAGRPPRAMADPHRRRRNWAVPSLINQNAVIEPTEQWGMRTDNADRNGCL